MKVIGLSCFYHDSAVAAVEDGEIRFAIQEERLSRVKHDNRFPSLALAKALDACGWRIEDVDVVVFYEDPDEKLRRIYRQVLDAWPNSWHIFSGGLPAFVREKYDIELFVRRHIGFKGSVRTYKHHRSHAAAAFLTSPFERALIVTIDGVGESESTVAWLGEGNSIRKLKAIHFPDSLGLFYSVMTDYLGFEVNEGEYKVMGLAPYGVPRFVDRILGNVIHTAKDGSFWLDQGYFDFAGRERHYTMDLVRHLGVEPRCPGDVIRAEHQDLAASVQRALESVLRNLLRALLAENPVKDVCLGGGVALNCTANAHLIRELGVRLHIHPASGDAGGALGAALAVAVEEINREPFRFRFSPYLGADFQDAQIEEAMQASGFEGRYLSDPALEVAKCLAAGEVVAVLRGRDEWGPRALGNRSILADPRSPRMKDHLNAKIKFREEFRPFAPVVLEERFPEYFETLGMASSQYMLFTHRAARPEAIPGAVHVDSTARVQTVNAEQNPFLHAVLVEFEQRTGTPILINTSFNLKGEPIVSSPADGLKTFVASGIDRLLMGNYLIERKNRGPLAASLDGHRQSPIQLV